MVKKQAANNDINNIASDTRGDRWATVAHFQATEHVAVASCWLSVASLRRCRLCGSKRRLILDLLQRVRRALPQRRLVVRFGHVGRCSSRQHPVRGMPDKQQSLRVRRVLCGHPHSTFFGVWLFDFEAASATQCRSEFSHHPLRDADAPSAFVVSGFRRCGPSLHLRVHHWKCSGGRHKVRIHLHTPILDAPKDPSVCLCFSSECCGKFLQLCLSLTRCGSEPATVQPLHSERRLLARGQGLESVCSPDAAIRCASRRRFRLGRLSVSSLRVVHATSRRRCRGRPSH